MEQPTKEEVEFGIEEARGYNFMLNPPAAIYRKKYIVMAKAYLALRDEVEQGVTDKLQLKRDYWEARELVDKLEADNQALKALCENLEISIPTPLRVTLVDEATEQKGTT